MLPSARSEWRKEALNKNEYIKVIVFESRWHACQCFLLCTSKIQLPQAQIFSYTFCMQKGHLQENCFYWHRCANFLHVDYIYSILFFAAALATWFAIWLAAEIKTNEKDNSILSHALLETNKLLFIQLSWDCSTACACTLLQYTHVHVHEPHPIRGCWGRGRVTKIILHVGNTSNLLPAMAAAYHCQCRWHQPGSSEMHNFHCCSWDKYPEVAQCQYSWPHTNRQDHS